MFDTGNLFNVLYSLVSENDKQHFSDLKEKVVFPLLNYLENARYQLPTIDNAKAKANISLAARGQTELDAILIDDFLNNHYPEIRTLWNNILSTIAEYLRKRML